MLIEEIKERVKTMDDQALRRLVFSDENDYQKGVYEIYLKEYKSRGNGINDLEKKDEISSAEKAYEKYDNWIKAGYVFALLGGLLGILIAYYIKPKKGEAITDGYMLRKRHFSNIITLSIIMIIFIKPLIKIIIQIITIF